LPPGDRPELVEALPEVAASAALLDFDAATFELVLDVVVAGMVDFGWVDVMTTVSCWFVAGTPLLLVVGGAVRTVVSTRVVCGGSVVWTLTEVLAVAAGVDDMVTTDGGCDEVWTAIDVVSTVTALAEVAGCWLVTGRTTWDDWEGVETPIGVSRCPSAIHEL